MVFRLIHVCSVGRVQRRNGMHLIILQHSLGTLDAYSRLPAHIRIIVLNKIDMIFAESQGLKCVKGH